MESWRLVWREGFFPSITTDILESLHVAVVNDDPRLVQGSTTTPPPLMCVQDWPCEAGCAIGFCGTHMAGGFGEATVGGTEERFAMLCFECDQRLGEPAACRWFLNWFDDTPRDEMRRVFANELATNIAERQKTAA